MIEHNAFKKQSPAAGFISGGHSQTQGVIVSRDHRMTIEFL